MLLFSLALANPLPDLASTTQRTSCVAPPVGTGAHPGAETFYTGAFRVDEAGSLVGEERKYLYGNATWKAKEGLSAGEDCVDRWNLTGKRMPAVDCADCTFAIQVSATIDPSRSSCKTRNASDASRYSVVYNVTVKGDTFALTFTSGKPIGSGKVDGSTYSWLGPQRCVWF